MTHPLDVLGLRLPRNSPPAPSGDALQEVKGAGNPKLRRKWALSYAEVMPLTFQGKPGPSCRIWGHRWGEGEFTVHRTGWLLPQQV